MKSDGRHSVIKRLDPVSKRPHIVPLQGLRAFAFGAIFISHVSLNYTSCGACAVSVFFVLSGFLLTIRSLGRDSETQCISCFAFSWNKIEKLFPLHILMSLPFIWSLLRSGASVPQSALTIAVNYLLLQSWVPVASVYFSLNAVSWYLSTALFTYLVFPGLLQGLKRLKSRKAVLIAAGVLLLVELLLSTLFRSFGSDMDRGWFSLHWLTYVCPPVRVIDFAGGMLAGRFFSMRNKYFHRSDRSSVAGYTLAEAGAVILAVSACLLFGSVPKAYRYTALFLLPSTFIVYIFASGKGLLSKLLAFDPIVWIGDLSGYAFLIHLGVLLYGGALINRVLPALPQPMMIIISAAATLLGATLYRRLIISISARRKNCQV